MKNEEMIWVPKEVAERFEKATSEEAQIKIIDKLIEKRKLDMKSDLECLEEDILMYRGMLLKYKKEIQSVFEEHQSKVYATWEEIDKSMPSMNDIVNKLKIRLNPLNLQFKEMLQIVKDLSEKMDSLNTYRLKEMIELIDKIIHTDNRTKNILLSVIKSGDKDR